MTFGTKPGQIKHALCRPAGLILACRLRSSPVLTFSYKNKALYEHPQHRPGFSHRPPFSHRQRDDQRWRLHRPGPLRAGAKRRQNRARRLQHHPGASHRLQPDPPEHRRHAGHQLQRRRQGADRQRRQQSSRQHGLAKRRQDRARWLQRLPIQPDPPQHRRLARHQLQRRWQGLVRCGHGPECDHSGRWQDCAGGLQHHSHQQQQRPHRVSPQRRWLARHQLQRGRPDPDRYQRRQR